MKVADWIAQHPGTVTQIAPLACLEHVIDLMLETTPLPRDVYVVSEDGALLGRVQYQSLLRTYLAEQHPTHTRRQIMERIARGSVREFMDRHFATATLDEDLDTVLDRQLAHDQDEMPVLDAVGKLIGAIKLADVLRNMRQQEKDRHKQITCE